MTIHLHWWCEDAWITTAALTQVTTRLKFLVAFRPGLLSPTLAAPTRPPRRAARSRSGSAFR